MDCIREETNKFLYEFLKKDYRACFLCSINGDDCASNGVKSLTEVEYEIFVGDDKYIGVV